MNWNKFFAENVAKRAIVAQAIENDPWCHDQGLRGLYDKNTPKECLDICKNAGIVIIPEMHESWDKKQYEPSEKLVNEIATKLIDCNINLPKYYN